MRRASLFFTIISLCGCMSAQEGTFDDATILNWENRNVTTEQFIRDHKSCLGITSSSYNTPRSSIEKFFMPNSSTVMPKWDGLWVTFQSNEYTELGQRLLISEPSNKSTASLGEYRKCMFLKGYDLRID